MLSNYWFDLPVFIPSTAEGYSLGYYNTSVIR